MADVSEWIPLAVYVFGWFVTARIVHTRLQRSFDKQRKEQPWSNPPGSAAPEAIAAAFLWPVIVAIGTPIAAVYGLYRLATAPLPTIRLPRLRRRSDAEYIAELERQLGIEGDR